MTRRRLRISLRAAVALATVVVGAATVVAGPHAAGHGGPLTGTWIGELTGRPSSVGKALRIVIVVNAAETGGSWKLGPSCHGPLSLDGISNGYHHYLRRLAPGATCAGGDVDCLQPVGAAVYDSVTSHLGGAYDRSGMLRRVRSV